MCVSCINIQLCFCSSHFTHDFKDFYHARDVRVGRNEVWSSYPALVKTSKNVASSTHISLLDMPECSYIFLVFRQHLPRDCRSISCFLKRAFSCCSAASFEHHVTFQYMGHNLLFIMIELFPCDISEGAAIFSKKV